MELEKVKQYIEENNMLQKGDSVIVGLSGGADSVCLLDMLSDLRGTYELQIFAVHVHHGIRGEEADRDLGFARKICMERKIELKEFFYDVPDYAKENKLSEEEAGRMLRYQSFEQVKNEIEKKINREQSVRIAVAHNQNDSVETVLHNMCRGTGLNGLSGIKPVNGNVIRPILCLKREEIEHYLASRGISYMEDSTNFGEDYTRNKIRNRVLLYLTEQINPETIGHISQMTQEVAEAEQYLKNQEQNWYKQIFSEHNNCIYADKQAFCELDSYMQKRTVRLAIFKLAGKLKDITRQHIMDILALTKKQSGRYIMLPYDIQVRMEQKSLVFEKRESQRKEKECCKKENQPTQAVLVQSSGQYEFENAVYEVEVIDVLQQGLSIKELEKTIKFYENVCTKWFDYDKISFTVQIRHRQTGDYFVVNQDGGRKKLKSYMIEEKIPASKRESIPLLTDGSHVMWIVGHRISEWYKISSETKKILKITRKEKPTDAG